MHLRNLLIESGPWPMLVDPVAMAERLAPVWRGSRVFMTRAAAKRRWCAEKRDPEGAAERLASDIANAILAEGGAEEHVERILLACMTSYVEL